MSRSPRSAVAAAFLIHATVSGTWAPRLPAIKESLGLSDGELGTALVGLAIGLVAGTRLSGPLPAPGIASGALGVGMNAQGIEVERVLRKPILSGLPGLWSLGLGLGA